MRQGVAQACIEPSRSGVVALRAADVVEFAEVFDADGDVGHDITSESSVDFIV